MGIVKSLSMRCDVCGLEQEVSQAEPDAPGTWFEVKAMPSCYVADFGTLRQFNAPSIWLCSTECVATWSKSPMLIDLETGTIVRP